MKFLTGIAALILLFTACREQPKAKKDEAYVNDKVVVMLLPNAAKVKAYSNNVGNDSMKAEAGRSARLRQLIRQLADKNSIKVLEDSQHVAVNFIQSSGDTVQIQRQYIDDPWPVIFFSPKQNPLVIGQEDPERAFKLYF